MLVILIIVDLLLQSIERLTELILIFFFLAENNRRVSDPLTLSFVLRHNMVLILWIWPITIDLYKIGQGFILYIHMASLTAIQCELHLIIIIIIQTLN